MVREKDVRLRCSSSQGKAKEGIWAGENANSALVSGEEVKPLPPSTSPRRKHLPLMIMLRKKPVLPPIFLQAASLQ